jgi:mono/diheme cytochrome c family protein
MNWSQRWDDRVREPQVSASGRAPWGNVTAGGKGRVRGLATVLWLSALVGASVCAAETPQELYELACASCHGHDGRGSPEGTALTVPLPDFTDCAFVTRETTANWLALVAEGGQALGLSRQMPGFEGVLSEEQARAVIGHVRNFCRDPSWPHADLNFRRPLLTGKAFPEDEVVATLTYETSGPARSLVTAWSLEKRLGARGQVELTMPLAYLEPRSGPRSAGVGDLAVAYKHVLMASQRHQAIAAVSLDLVLPTGDRRRGLGDGTVGLGPSLRVGKALGPFVLQAEVKAVLPLDVDRAARRVVYRAALQAPLGPLRRAWVPSLEFEVDTRMEGAARDSYALAPGFYKGLSKSGHVAVAIGAKIPLGGSQAPDYQIGAFLLWEYLEGGLWW